MRNSATHNQGSRPWSGLVPALVVAVSFTSPHPVRAIGSLLVQLVDCQAVKLAMKKEAVATPVYFQQMDLEGQAALENLSWYLAHGTHSLPAKRWFIHACTILVVGSCSLTVTKTDIITSNTCIYRKLKNFCG